MKWFNKLDPVLVLLFYGMLTFLAATIFVDLKMPNDGQIFQVTSNLLSGLAGAFLLRVKPQSKEEEAHAIGGSVNSSETLAIKNPPATDSNRGANAPEALK